MLTAVACLLAFGAALTHAQALDLATDGRTDYVIVTPADAIPAEKTAAQELQSHLLKVTGAQFAIRSETDGPVPARAIVVGVTEGFRAACPDIEVASLKHDGIVLRTRGDTLYLAGGRPRGTLYAVYSFLEDVVGCRWWSATESYTPHTPTLKVEELNTVYVPKLQYREAFYRGAFDGIYAARSKCNGHFERVPEEYGGHYRLLGWCHTFFQLLPPEKYFEQHPDWYSEINGKRLGTRGQLCLTNDEMRAELTRQALEWIRKDPTAGIISIAQNDWGNPCQCARCRKIVEEEGSESGPLLRFVNAVAADIEKEYPDVLVETLAYHYTRKPPTHVTPRPNVIIRLCSIECSYAQPLTGPQNQTFKEDIEGWSAIAPQLYIWDYVTNFANYLIPHPNLRVLAPNIRFFVDHKAIGLFEQGDAGSTCGELVELRAWLLAHLMWDPSRDENALIDEFLDGYYGPAGRTIRQYIEVTHDAVERAGTYLRCGMRDTSAWFTPQDVFKATQLMNQATEQVKGDPVLADRVRRARLPLDLVWLSSYRSLRAAAEAAGQAALAPADPQAALEDFLTTCKRFNVGNYREGVVFTQLEDVLRARMRPAGPPPDQCKDLPAGTWFDVQDNAFTLYGVPNWAKLGQDPLASDGYAARMTTNHVQWATQCRVEADCTGRYHCYVVARCQPKLTADGKLPAGQAFKIGIYDPEGTRSLVTLEVSIADAAGDKYHTFDLGTHDLKPGMYFWLAPMDNPDAVQAIYTDRIFGIREQ
jgi:hypothetical protein